MILRVEDKFGVVHILKIYENDVPETVAQNFGLLHGLDQTSVTALTKNIYDSLYKLGNRRTHIDSTDGNYLAKSKGRPSHTTQDSRLSRGSKNSGAWSARGHKRIPSDSKKDKKLSTNELSGSRPVAAHFSKVSVGQPSLTYASLHTSSLFKYGSQGGKPIKRKLVLDTDPINNGEKNYIVGVKKQEAETKRIKDINQKEVKKVEAVHHTFKPRILKTSHEIAVRAMESVVLVKLETGSG